MCQGKSKKAKGKSHQDRASLCACVPLLLCAFVPSKASPAWTNYAKRTQFSKSQIDLSYCHTKDYGSKIALDTW
ncbi:MAG: hypothetical protein AMJ75_08915 [Phycisphaerae bacterium SM1_79]|nr:MAG: hypothetical protein AMJ75_08915 [Phycisphaerae bacterium SM1_79]